MADSPHMFENYIHTCLCMQYMWGSQVFLFSKFRVKGTFCELAKQESKIRIKPLKNVIKHKMPDSITKSGILNRLNG